MTVSAVGSCSKATVKSSLPRRRAALIVAVALAAPLVASAPAATAAPASASVPPRVVDGVTVHDNGRMAVVPRITAVPGGDPVVQLGLADTAVGAAATWTPATDAVVHLAAPDEQGRWTTPAADGEFGGEATLFGTGQRVSEHVADGGLLLGFDDQLAPGEMNGGLAGSFGPTSTFEVSDVVGPSGRGGWSATRSGVDWDTDPASPTRTLGTVWDPIAHEATWYQTRSGSVATPSPGWTFDEVGTWCITITEPLRTKVPKGSPVPAVDLTRAATYTVVVGELPSPVVTCDQPTEQEGPRATIVDGGHHDLRTYVDASGELAWGLDSSLTPLSTVVLAGTPAPATVEAPTSGTDDARVLGPVGTSYWYFPMTGDATGRLWPGLSTESVLPSQVSSTVSFSLDGWSRDGVAEPEDGRVVLLSQLSGTRDSVLLDSAEPGTSSFEHAPNEHSHPLWAFTSPGVHCVGLTAGVQLADGRWSESRTEVTFVVGDEVDPATVAPCGTKGDLPVRTDRDERPATVGSVHVARDEAVLLQPTLDGRRLGAVAATATTSPLPRDASGPVADAVVRDPADLVIAVPTRDTATGPDAYRAYSGAAGSVTLSTDRLVAGALGGDRTLNVTLGDVRGPRVVEARTQHAGRVISSLSSAPDGDKTVTLDVPTRSTELEWRLGRPGVYCVPLTLSTTLDGGSRRAHATTLTLVAGGGTPGGPALDGLTTCSRGQQPTPQGATPPPAQGDGDEGPGHDDVYVPSGSTTDSGAVILNDGHIDIATTLEGDRLVTSVKDTTTSTTPTWRRPAETVLQVLPEARTSVPGDPSYSFLGAPGAPLWQLSQTAVEGLLWPGWSTESLPAEATRGGVTWDLNAVEGLPNASGTPSSVGEFTLHQLVGLGRPEVLLDSDDATANRFVIPKAVHAHGVWSFSAEGTYCLSMTRSAVLAGGQPVADDFVLAVSVGAVDVRAVDPGRCFAGAPPAGDALGGTVDEPGAEAPAAAPQLVAAMQPACTPRETTTSSSRAVLSSGHVDWATRVVDGRLRSLVKDGTTSSTVWREPSSTVIWVKPSAQERSVGGAFSFLGGAGAPVWQIPQTQDRDLVWLGWNTEELTSAQVQGPVTWTLTGVDGPGAVTVYELSSFGAPQVILTPGGSTQIPLGVHAHGNWAFSAEGTYTLRFSQTATLADGRRSTDVQSLTVVVGGTAPATTVEGPTRTSGATDCLPGTARTVATVVAPEAVQAADEPVAASSGVRRAPSATTAAPAPVPDGLPTWALAALGFGGVLAAGGAGAGGWWLLRRRGAAA